MKGMRAMKVIFSFLLVAFFSSLSFGNITQDQEYLLNHDGIGYHKAQLGTLLTKTRNLLVAKYSFAVLGGSSSADISLVPNLGFPKILAKLPSRAIVTNVWLDIITQPVSGGSATVAIKSEAAADMLAATAKASLPVSIKQGIPFGSSVSTFLRMTAERTIKATIGTADLTAGKFNVYIEYVIGD